jgi:hypothetical protein
MLEKTKVAYLLGTDHSGSTLMAFLLDSHPELTSTGESCPPLHFFNTDYLCSCGEAIRACPFYAQLSREMLVKGVSFSADNWDNTFCYSNETLNSWLGWYPRNRWKRKIQEIANTYLPIHNSRVERVKRVNLAFYQSALSITGAKVFCDTTKEHLRFQLLSQMEELDFRLIWLVRDVRAFVHSCKKFGLEPGVSAKLWLNYQEITCEIYASFPADRKIQLRYEELCQTPDATLRRLHAFLGVEPLPVPELLDQSKHHVLGNKMRTSGTIRIRADEAWRQELKAHEVELALSIAGKLNAELGYN